MAENWATSAQTGRVGDALKQIADLRKSRLLTPDEAVAESELLDAVSSSDLGLIRAEELLRKRDLRKDLLARCFAVIGSQHLRVSRIEQGLAAFDKSSKYASQAEDVRLSARLQVARFGSLATWVSPEAASAEVAHTRRLVTSAGEPDLVIRFRLVMAELEAKRGALRRAQEQLDVAGGMLTRYGNLLLDTERSMKSAAIATLSADVPAGALLAKQALALSSRCGSTSLEVVARSNLAHVLLLMGHEVESEREFEKALNLCRSGGGAEHGIRDGMALHA